MLVMLVVIKKGFCSEPMVMTEYTPTPVHQNVSRVAEKAFVRITFDMCEETLPF